MEGDWFQLFKWEWLENNDGGWFVSVVYQVGVGSGAGLDDIASLLNVSHETTTLCFAGLSLQHAHIYYTMVRALNGGHIEKDVTGVSDGGKYGNISILVWISLYACISMRDMYRWHLW